MTGKIGNVTWAVGSLGCWIRLGDHGLRVISHRKIRPLYSERTRAGGRRYWHVGHWCLGTLGPRSAHTEKP